MLSERFKTVLDNRPQLRGPIDATPMHPEYPCAHCISSASLAGVMEVVFGTTEVPKVSIAIPTAPGIVHDWTNMRAFSDEVSEARIWAGVHYRFSTKVGQDMGQKIGVYVAKNLMQPVAMVARRLIGSTGLAIAWARLR
jgi:hypothetical protein